MKLIARIVLILCPMLMVLMTGAIIVGQQIEEQAIAYAGADGEPYGIFLLDLKTLVRLKLTTPETFNISPSWSPDGKSVVFQTAEVNNFNIENFEIVQMDIFTRERDDTAVQMPGTSGPALSSDGQKLAVSGLRLSSSGNDIYVRDLSTGDVSNVTDSNRHDNQPKWSPDSSKLVFVSNGDRTPYDLFIHDFMLGVTENITNGSSWSLNPAWLPDGGHLVYSSQQDGDFDLYVMDIASGEEWQLTDFPDDELTPAWSPYGRYLTFARGNDQTGYNLYVVEIDEAFKVINVRQITAENSTDPAWRPVLP